MLCLSASLPSGFNAQLCVLRFGSGANVQVDVNESGLRSHKLSTVSVLCRRQNTIVRMVAGLAFGLASIQGRICGAILSTVRGPACVIPVHRMPEHVPASASADLC